MRTPWLAVTAMSLSLFCGPSLVAQDQPQGQASATSLLAPPTVDGPVAVRASFHLQDLVDIDDDAETFEFTGILTLTWQDKRQAFDPNKEQVKEKIYQGDYQFNELAPAWYPQVVLANESGQFEKHGTLLRVRPDGTSTLIQTVSATAEVDLDMRRFPFDAHRLDAVFKVLGFDSNEVALKALPLPKTGSTQGIQISQWGVVGLTVSSGEQDAPYLGAGRMSSTLVASIHVERKSFFMVRLVILPLILIVVLSWSVFWMDRSSLGDRINVSFIGILTAVAYQVVVGDILPHISYMTLMNAILNFSFFVMCLTVVANIVVGELDKRGKAQAGNRFDYRCRLVFPLVYFGLLLMATIVTFVFF